MTQNRGFPRWISCFDGEFPMVILMVRFGHLGHFFRYSHSWSNDYPRLFHKFHMSNGLKPFMNFMKYFCLIKYCGVPQFVKHIMSRL